MAQSHALPTFQMSPAHKMRQNLSVTWWYHHLFFKWEACMPTQQICSVLWYSCSRELHFWSISCVRAFMLLALETSPRLLAKRRSGRNPPWRFFSLGFSVVLHSLMERIPFRPPSESFMFHHLQMVKKKKKSQLTNREESFYLISLWSPTFWHVCSALQLNEFDHRMWVFLTVSSLLFSSPFIVSLSLFLYSCFVCFKARLPPDYPLTFFSSWWNLFCPSDS